MGPLWRLGEPSVWGGAFLGSFSLLRKTRIAVLVRDLPLAGLGFPPTPLPALSSLGPAWGRAPLWRGPFAALLLAPIVMATLFCGAAPVVARSPFCRPEEDPFLLLESTLRSLQEILRRSQGGPLRRPWDEQPYGEEEITILEEEVMPAIEQCLSRVEELDQRLVNQRERLQLRGA